MFKNIGWFHIFFISKMAQCLKTLVGFTFFHIEDGAMFKKHWLVSHFFHIEDGAMFKNIGWFHIFFISKMAQCLKTLVGFTFFSYRRWRNV